MSAQAGIPSVVRASTGTMASGHGLRSCTANGLLATEARTEKRCAPAQSRLSPKQRQLHLSAPKSTTTLVSLLMLAPIPLLVHPLRAPARTAAR